MMIRRIWPRRSSKLLNFLSCRPFVTRLVPNQGAHALWRGQLYHTSSIILGSSSEIASVTFTDGEGNVYQGVMKNDKMHGFGIMKYKNGNVYEGTWKNGKFDGTGKLLKKDLGVYVGDLKNGKLNGKGVLTFDDGDVYEGEFKNDHMHGTGKFTYTDGEVYEGQLEKSQWCGEGVRTFSNGDVYTGSFRDHDLNGEGVMRFANGDVYEGQWEDGMFSGRGKYTLASGGYYDGDWVKAMQTGHGHQVTEKGDTYTGGFKDNEYHGKGTLVVLGEEGLTYEGDWVKGKMSGEGRMTTNKGVSYDGEFKDGLFDGDGVYTCPEFTYDGSFKKNMRHGGGYFRSSDGDTYDGQWFEHKMHGEGELVSSKGLKYTGGWIANQMSGQGEIEQVNGDHYLGGFLADKYDGYGILTKKGMVDQIIAANMAVAASRKERMTALTEEEEALYRDKLSDALVKQFLTPVHRQHEKYLQETKQMELELTKDGKVPTLQELKEKLPLGSIPQGGVHSKIAQIYSGATAESGSNSIQIDDNRKALGSGTPSSGSSSPVLLPSGNQQEMSEEEEVVEVDLTTPINIDEQYVTPQMMAEFKAITSSPTMSIYEGYFKDGKQHGQGKLTLPNGVVFEGEWKEDYMHGQGILRDATGQVIHEGLFDRGGYVSGHFVDADGNPITRRPGDLEEKMQILDELREGLEKAGAKQLSEKDFQDLAGSKRSGLSETMKNRKALK